MKTILSQMNKTYTGTTLARIAVEVGEEEDIRLLVKSGKIDWSQKADNEDPAILWALKNDKLSIFDILARGNTFELQDDPSTDQTIICGSEEFRVHRNLLCHRSPVFTAMLSSSFKEAREGIEIKEMNSSTLSSMIHFIYTMDLAEGWKDLDILDVARAADMYEQYGWMVMFFSKLVTTDISGEQLAEMIIGSRHSEARKIIIDKIREDKYILQDPGFIERFRNEDHLCLILLLQEI